MPSQRLETQPYYVHAGHNTLMDGRLDGILAAQLEHVDLAGSDQPTDRWQIPYTHNLTLVDSRGRDGEVSSGAVELVDIKTPEGGHIAAIRSALFDNEDGMTVDGCNWSVELSDPALARDFWASWRPSFQVSDARKAFEAYIKHHPEARHAIRGTPLGLLQPWYMQRQGDQRLLEHYSTEGDRLVHLPRTALPASDLVTGLVYRVPQRERWTTRISSYAARTCLAAFVMPPRERRYLRDEPQELFYVQWGDGVIESFDREQNELPKPLQTNNLKPPTTTDT